MHVLIYVFSSSLVLDIHSKISQCMTVTVFVTDLLYFSSTRSGLTLKPRIEMTRHPTVNSVPLTTVTSAYGAKFFRDALARYVVQKNNPAFTDAQVERHSASVHIPMQKVPVFHKVKFWVSDPHGLAAAGTETRDVVHARPGRKSKYDDDLPARFDTALVRNLNEQPSPDQRGVHRTFDSYKATARLTVNLQHLGFRVAQVRVIFKIPNRAMAHLFPTLAVHEYPTHLAYVEWFTKFTTPGSDHGMYKISRALNRDKERRAGIIPVESFERSCHLIPEFGPVAPRNWTSSNVLDECKYFFVNPFIDCNTYKLLY